MKIFQKIKISILAFMIAFTFSDVIVGQSAASRIYAPCPNTTQQAEVKINGGYIDLKPCPGRSVRNNGVPLGTGGSNIETNLSVKSGDSASFTGGELSLPITAVSGANRTKFFPFFSGANILAKSPFMWDGDAFQFNNLSTNTNFSMVFQPEDSNGVVAKEGQFQLGGGNSMFYMDAYGIEHYGVSKFSNSFVTQSPIEIQAIAGTTAALLKFNVDSVPRFNVKANGVLTFDRTLSTAKGNTTINKPAFSVTFNDGATSLIVTNSLIQSTTRAICQVLGNDENMKSVSVQISTGSMTLYPNVYPNEATSVYCELRDGF